MTNLKMRQYILWNVWDSMLFSDSGLSLGVIYGILPFDVNGAL